MKGKKHIDDEQPPTVDEHFEAILKDRTIIDSEFVKMTPDDLPEWFDERLFKLGQRYYVNNLIGFSIAHSNGLTAILAIPDIFNVLVYTKRNVTVVSSVRRYAGTLLLMYSLFHSDIFDSSSKWFKALNTIRWKHAAVSKERVQKGLHGIYQKDMAFTQFGFIGFALICPEKVGLAHSTDEEKMGFHHLWRVASHMLGVPDRLNMCRKTVAETTELCRRVAYEVLAKHLEKPSPDFLWLAKKSLRGLQYIDLTIDQDAFFYLAYEMTGVKYDKPLGWYSYLNMKFHRWLRYLCSAPYIGKVVRTICSSILAGLYWLVENYPVVDWLSFGKERSRICLYANT